MRKTWILGGLGLLALGAVAAAQVITVPQVTQIGATDLFQDIVGGSPQAGNYYAPAPLLGNYAATQPGNNAENDLIGGDFGVNLFQDGTTVSSISTTSTYVADQWAAFSGTSTTLAGAQETAAADIPAGFTASLRITRSGAGIIQSCVAQIVPAGNVARFQGQTAEIDFHALAGAGFSAASSNLSVLLVTGTGTNDTMANLAKTINSALSGTAWAGAVTSTVTVPISSVAWARYGVVAPVPVTATELGVALCWTPVGASPSNDYFEFTGAMLTPNSASKAFAGTAGAAYAANDPRAKSFPRRPQSDETNLQYAFYYRINEGALGPSRSACHFTTANSAMQCPIIFPVPMFKAPTMAYTTGFAGFTTTAETTANNCTGLGTDATVALAASITQVMVQCTIASGTAAAVGLSMTLIDNGNTGKIAASARF